MKTTIKNTLKIIYIPPKIERIKLDNAISLALESLNSTPPTMDNESSLAPGYFNNDPFKTHLG